MSCSPKALLVIVACALPLGTACGPGAGVDLASPPAREVCAPALAPGVPAAPLTAIHAEAKEAGTRLGERMAAEYIAARTADGYRLRRILSTLTMGLGLLLVGGLLGNLLLHLLGKRPSLRYAKLLGDTIERESGALRALIATEGPGHDLLAPLLAPLDATDRAAERLVDLATPLERDANTALAASRRAELYATLEGLADHLERLHFQAIGWQDRLHREAPSALADEVAVAAVALSARLEGLS